MSIINILLKFQLDKILNHLFVLISFKLKREDKYFYLSS